MHRPDVLSSSLQRQWTVGIPATATNPPLYNGHRRPYAVSAMSAIIIFVSTGLLVYWFARTVLLLNGPEEAVDETLAYDLWWGRKVLLGLRTMFVPPQQFLG